HDAPTSPTRRSSDLARQDGLTRLPNRLALREYFEDHAALCPADRLVAVHYLDLDAFKPVNDRHGHATGDALLAAVGERLNGAVRDRKSTRLNSSHVK